MRENQFQKKFIEQLKAARFVVLNLSDKFTSGIPDIYCAKDGVSYWYELKVINKTSGEIDLSDKSGGYGFTKAQKILIYKLRQVGIEAWGIIYVTKYDVTVKVPPEDFSKKLTLEELVETYEKVKF